MAQSVSVLEARVRAMLRDVKRGDYAVPSFQLWELMESRLKTSMVPLVAETRTADYVTLAANTRSYALPPSGVGQLAYLREFLHQPDLRPLVKVLPKLIDEWQANASGSYVGTGPPSYFALRANADQTWTLFVDPIPKVSGGKLTAVFCAVPTSFAEDPATVVGLGESGLTSLVYLTASDCIAVMGKESLAKLGLDDKAAGRFQALGDAALEAEFPRVHQGKIQDRLRVTFR